MIIEFFDDYLPSITGVYNIPALFQALYGIFKICILFLCFILDLLLLPIELIIFFIRKGCDKE